MSTTRPARRTVAALRAVDLPVRRTAALLAGLVALELLLLVAYLAVSGVGVTAPRYLLYPFVWLDASLLAALGVGRTLAGTSHPLRARVTGWLVGAGYLAVLLWAGGLVGLDGGGAGLRVVAAPPGWGPMLLYDGSLLHLSLVPFKLVGAVTLAWLVAVVVRATGRPLLAGSLGLFSCVGCTGSLLLAAVTAVAGGSATVLVGVANLAPLAPDLSTLVFVGSLAGLVASALRIG